MKKENYVMGNVRDNVIIPLSFDTETNGLGGELLCITAHDGETNHYLTGDDMIDNFFNYLFSRPLPYVWFAHHAQYDWRYLMGHIIDKELDVEINMRTDNDIYQIVIKKDGNKYVMRDSMALFPESLKAMADTFCPEIPKQKIDIEHFNPNNPEHKQYALRDTEILRLAMPRMDTMLRNNFGVGLGHTTAGTALSAWESEIIQPIKTSKDGEREQFIREGYFGGLVFLTSSCIHHDCETYDINSSYPSVMVEHGVPGGRCVDSDDYMESRPGIYSAVVRAPDNLIIPILPCRNERGIMQWRRGEFETVVTNYELTFAANHGYEILEIKEGLVWEHNIFPFNRHIENCKRMREKYKGLPQEKLPKLLQNSLYGKYGSKRERSVIFHPKANNEMIDATPLDSRGYFWIKKEYDEFMRCKPEWAVFITAHARIKLLSAAYKVGIENVIYGDTDSLTVLSGHKEKIDVGNEYGQFKLEKIWREFRALGPKLYSGVLSNGKLKGAAKGLSKKNIKDKNWVELLRKGETTVSKLSLPSLRVSIKKGVSPAMTLVRKSSDLNKSNNYEKDLQTGAIWPKIAI